MHDVHDALAAIYRHDARRVRATLVRLLGFDAAEEAVHEAFAAAAEQWPRDGVPANPFAWLVSAGRFRMIDRWRKHARLDAAMPELLALAEAGAETDMTEHIEDDQLRLIFICCHPALPAEARVALTLREVCGLTTEEIARAFLLRAPTVAQRIVRAKASIRAARLPYEVPAREQLPERLDSVLQVIYLIFNEGYAATRGDSLTRASLCEEALRLGQLLVTLCPAPEAMGLVALMQLHEARRETRADASGDLVLLEHQDRSVWNQPLIRQAVLLIERALAERELGSYLLQASIAAVHAQARSAQETDWTRIVALYDLLQRAEPSAVVALNRAVALGMRDGAAAGLAAIDAAFKLPGLDAYAMAHAARADMCRRLGQVEAARTAYQRALSLTHQGAERRFLQGRLAQLGEGADPGGGETG